MGSINQGIGIPDVFETVEALRHHETYRQDWHAHARALEVHTVFTGAISYEFADGHPPARILGGAFLAIPRGIRHRAVNAEGTPSVRLVVRLLAPPMERPVPFCPFEPGELNALVADVAAHPFRPFRMSPRLQRAARELFRAVEEGDRPHVVRLAGWTYLAEASQAVETAAPQAPRGDDVVDVLCALLRARCGERLRMSELVCVSGYSERRLFALFRERLGMTPAHYLARCRIDRAKRLMAERPRPRLLDVAIACGFSTPSHFSAVFRQYEGVTPRAAFRS